MDTAKRMCKIVEDVVVDRLIIDYARRALTPIRLQLR